MLTRLITDLYVWIVEIALWLVLMASGIAGYHFTVPALNAAGWLLENEPAWKLLGAIVFAIASLLVFCLAYGPFLLLVDIRRSLKILELKNDRGSRSLQPPEFREPWDSPGALDTTLSPHDYARDRWG